MTLRKRRPGLVYPVNEDWIYVGSGGSAPAFQNSWTTDSGSMALAFRIREAGVVDVHGVANGTSASGVTIFTLPAGYRPSTSTRLIAITSSDAIARVDVSSSGTVALASVVNKVYFSMQMFLDLPEVAS